MKNYRVEKYSSSNFNEWNDFVLKAKNATFLFHRDFIEYHYDRFEDHSLMIFKGDDLIAALPANRSGNRLYSHAGLTYGGLVIKKDIRFIDILESFAVMLEQLHNSGFQTLELKSIPHIYNILPSDELNYIMFLLNAELVRTDLLAVVDLNREIKFSKSRLEGCKRAGKNNLHVVEVEDFTEFWDEILIPNLESKYDTKPVHSLTEITYLKKKFPEHIRQFNVYNGNKIVAGTTIFETQTVAHTQYISGNKERSKLGSLDLLHAYLITEKFSNKQYFDFGSSNENNGMNVNGGLLFWKEGFGAKPVTQSFYRINTNRYPNLRNVML